MARRAVLTGIVFLACLASAFFMYCQFRRTAFGFNAVAVVLGWTYGAAMSIPVMALTAIPLVVVEYIRDYVIPQRRFRVAACVACGYRDAGQLPVCPECGGRPAVAPRLGSVLVRTAKLVFAAWLLAIVLGALLGEAWLQVDETAFRREVAALQTKAGVPTPQYRVRRWPAHESGFFYSPGKGFWCND